MDHLSKHHAKLASLQSAMAAIPEPSTNAAAPRALLARCPVAAETPLDDAPGLAARAGIARISIKDERARMGLGSFKALGAAYVIARDAQDGQAGTRTYVTASAGNHGLSVAAGAQAFGAKAIVFLAETVPASFAARLESHGAEVRRAGDRYEDSMAVASAFAEAQGFHLLSDSSWPGYTAVPHTLMEGYLVLMAEVAEQIDAPPTHIFLQAGVGGFAAACAAFARSHWGSLPRIVVVEPKAAPAIHASMRAGAPVSTEGPVSSMGRLDCKEPSLIALKGLARDADDFLLISEAQAETGHRAAHAAGWPTTQSGAAGLAALLASKHQALGLTKESHALVILTEEAEE